MLIKWRRLKNGPKEFHDSQIPVLLNFNITFIPSMPTAL